MSFKIAIASGKGGTGKTTVAVNLQQQISKHLTDKVQLIDCDVEEPNDLLFFSDHEKIDEQKIYRNVPQINKERCTECMKCVEICAFNAIVILPTIKFAEINSSLCHSCSACSYVCEDQAIEKSKEEIGIVTKINNKIGDGLLEGRLKVGSAMQTMMIRETKQLINSTNEITLFDAPPGTSCAFVETVSDADYVILVTEPTPFGLHDMKLTIKVLEQINKPFGVVINKAYQGSVDVEKYLKTNNIELLTKLPFNKNYASEYAMGNILNGNNEMEVYYYVLISKLKELMK